VQGTEITLIADGTDETEAVEALAAVVASATGEC
jgi:phosphotransferase system HPr-like phosphotransfer protein